MRFLVSGANGFVGRALCQRLLRDGHHVRAAMRTLHPSALSHDQFEAIVIPPLEFCPSWNEALSAVDIVIHLAARVHVMRDTASDPLQEFRRINLTGTEHLARQAARVGVRRFVFLSTIGVNGDNSGAHSYTEQDVPQPHSPYARSKHEAEQSLEKIGIDTGMEIVIIRPPLVYGPGNPGNFLTLLTIVSKGIPLPLASVRNRRSLIYVENLADCLALCALHPAAAGQTYLVCDNEDISTPALLDETATALGVRSRLFHVPPYLMHLLATLTGKEDTLNKLLGSLTIDCSKIVHELAWQPPFSLSHGLRDTAGWFRRNRP